NAGANNMRLIADGTWRADLALTNQSGVEFKFAANGNWTTNWGEYDQLLTNLPMGGAADWESDNIVLPGTLDGRYRFTFNEYTRGYRVELAPEPDADSDGMPDAWETAHGLNPLNASDAGGNPDHDAYNNLQEYQHDTDPNAWNWPRTTLGGMCVAASFNGWAPSLTNMCLVADYTWRWDAAFTNLSGVEFKFAANGGWTTNWGDNDQSDTNVPFSGSGESYGANIRADTLTGSYRFMFNEQTLAYSLEAIATRDTDGDGIEDGWEADHGLNPKSGEDAWADADSDGLANHDEFSLDGDPGDGDTDGDGAGDLAEAIAGTGLANADSFFAADPGTSPTNFALSWPGATGRVYDVYSATGSLVNAAWNPVAGFTSITGSAGTMTVNLGPRPLAAEFFKVKVSR
ncbi:MAG: hypothetical protein JXB13_02600, partial [Phycisphaerae bacterium]|nr:hypothetical protein [Phycisphaerae bacterium]